VDIAKQIVRTSLNLTDQDVLHVGAWSHTTELASSIAREASKVGADAWVSYYDDSLWLADFVEKDEKYLERKSPVSAHLAEIVTAQVELGGPRDPKVFDRTKPSRMSKAEAWHKEIVDRHRERKVRSVFVGLGQVTPQRARKYGVSYPKWRRAVTAALGYDLRRLAATGQRVAKNLSGAPEVRVTAEGTDVTLSLSGRGAMVDDGIIDTEDIARGHLHAALPVGTTSFAPVETSAEGTVTFPTVPLWGKMIRDLEFTFRGGCLVEYRAGKNLKAFTDFYEAGSGDKDRIAWLSVGLNPKCTYVGGFVDHLVAGAASIGIGANEEIGGANKGLFEFGGTLPRATVQAGSVTIVDRGKLAF